jgi:SAM-dependent methyltransferase
MAQFDFGSNWRSFSENKLDDGRLKAAIQSLQFLSQKESFEGLSFLDIGCGSGLFSIAAFRLGAKKSLGIDVNPTCISVSKSNADSYKCPTDSVSFKEMSVLDGSQLSQLESFDIVYAWGSLHHTGKMWEAITNSAKKVKEGGLFCLAIYKKHWTSPLWNFIKWSYNRMPRFLQKPLLFLFAGLIFAAKLIITRENPLKKERGMDFWHDVIDWMGGYPYEYASEKEVKDYVTSQGFRAIHTVLCKTPTGCNEFAFYKNRF